MALSCNGYLDQNFKVPPELVSCLNSGRPLGIIRSRFNSEFTELLQSGAEEILKDWNIPFQSLAVPGAMELPFAAELLLSKGCAALIILGCVIRGETSHYDFVCDYLVKSLANLKAKDPRPLGIGVLTVENIQQAKERCGGKHGHKGREAAQVVLEQLSLEWNSFGDLSRLVGRK